MKKKLFKQLNLDKSNKSENPKDFYNYILLLLNKNFDAKLSKLDRDNEYKSYSRLEDFVFNRSHIKKVIMTIPYNVSKGSIYDYIENNLVLLEDVKTLPKELYDYHMEYCSANLVKFKKLKVKKKTLP